jgi:hypothetical protein
MSFSDIITIRSSGQVIMVVAETSTGQIITYYFRQVDPARFVCRTLERRGYHVKAALLGPHEGLSYSDQLDPNDPFIFDVKA